MTNEQIIFTLSQQLAKDGIITYTGETVERTLPDGSTKEYPETEPIHTYKKWQELGFQVMKGQKAITKAKIWKPYRISKEQKEREEEMLKQGKVSLKSTRMFLKTSAFFSQSQVEPIRN